MTPLRGFSPPGRGLIVAAAFVIVMAGLHAAAAIVAPFLLAVFIAIVATPPLRWLRRRGAPKWGALLVITFVLLDFGSLFALATTGALEGFRDSLPTYQERLVVLTNQFGGWLENVGMPNSREAVPDIFDPTQAMAVVKVLLSNASGLFADGLLILFTVIFILLEAPGLPAKLKAAFKTTDQSDARIKKVLSAVNQYMLIKTLASLATAGFIWIWLWFLGIDFAVLWAMLAFLLNFVPFVGSILMAIPAVLLALVQTDIATTLLVAAGYLVVNTAIGSILEPKIMGRGLGISTLAVFLSLLFWGFVLGTVGVFLSVPLTMVLIIAFEASPLTRPIAILLGPDIASDSVAVPQPTADQPQAVPGQQREETQQDQ
ncbi:AI-2E family transporter [uncultured Thiodictyon sp.]|uniref:AI-2E family transporter n=1 Tax=uncultured Thiodictyon sp. TaxID=1846217 RepID=UPI0025DCE7C9|nr:AI-2E family transporter [uncultured Thiodictyon sp.]